LAKKSEINDAKKTLIEKQWRIYAKWRPWKSLNVRPF